MRRNRVFSGIVAASAFFLAVGIQAQAQQTRTDAGHTLIVPVSSETISLDDGRSMVRVTSTGFVVADDPASPFHMVSATCTFTDMLAEDGSLISSNGYCSCMDSEGDAYGAWGRADAEGGNWSLIPGSGKFKNATGGGTYRTVMTWGDGKSAIRWDAKWSR